MRRRTVYLCCADDLCNSLHGLLLSERPLSTEDYNDDDDEADNDEAADDCANYDANLSMAKHTTQLTAIILLY